MIFSIPKLNGVIWSLFVYTVLNKLVWFMQKEKFHFSGLTGLRGIAASIVVFSHVDQFHYLFDYNSFGFEKFGFAEDAVTLFFVLSGFLITFLLLKEKETSGSINIRSFYMRRVLRIWPAYYLAVLLSLVLIFTGIIKSPENFPVSLSLYIFFLSNVAYVLALPIRAITPLWSVGVEEQFYAIWPWIILKSKNVYKSMWMVIVSYLILKMVFWHIESEGGEYQLIKLTRIDSMAIGGWMGAIYYFKKDGWLKVFYSKYIQLLSIFICFIPFLMEKSWPYHLEIELKSFAYAIIILNVATNKGSLLKTENRVLDFLGNISYGMYVYHMIILFLFSFVVDSFNLKGISNQMSVVLLICFIGTVCFSYLSYKVVEEPFLKLKLKYNSISKS